MILIGSCDCVFCLASLKCTGILCKVLCVTVCVSVGLCVRALLLPLFGCESPVDGDRLKHVAAREGEIYIDIICRFVGTKRIQSYTGHGENDMKVLTCQHIFAFQMKSQKFVRGRKQTSKRFLGSWIQKYHLFV